MSQYLVRRGLLEQRTTPSPHIVAKFPTFKHPRGNLRVTVLLTSNVALPSYWANTRYNLASCFDRIYCEDGQPAVSAASPFGMLSTLMRIAVPIFPYRMTYRSEGPEDGGKYVTLQHTRDPIESRMAFDAVKRGGDEPLVDPRARRLCQALEELGDTVASGATGGRAMTVAVPWHMYHAPYITEKLKANGWEVQQNAVVNANENNGGGAFKIDEHVLATRRMMQLLMLFVSVCSVTVAWVFFDMVFQVVGAIFGFLFR